MNDFATEEFLTKNIRVRPVSGVTKGGDMEETKTNNDYIHYPVGKSMLMSGDGGEDEEKFNKMINIDMEEQRKNIKSRVSYIVTFNKFNVCNIFILYFLLIEGGVRKKEVNRGGEESQEEEQLKNMRNYLAIIHYYLC